MILYTYIIHRTYTTCKYITVCVREWIPHTCAHPSLSVSVLVSMLLFLSTPLFKADGERQGVGPGREGCVGHTGTVSGSASAAKSAQQGDKLPCQAMSSLSLEVFDYFRSAQRGFPV